MARTVKKSEERRAEIVGAARSLFQTKEYEKTTMQDVMDRLKIAKGTIYHYFKSKEALLEAVIEKIVEENFQEMKALVDTIEGNALEKIERLVMAGRLSQDHPQLLEDLHSPGNAGMHIRLLAEMLNRQAPLYAELIQQGCDEKLFETSHPLECAEWILSALQFLTDLGIHPWTEEDLGRRAQALPRLVERQLNAKPGVFNFLFK